MNDGMVMADIQKRLETLELALHAVIQHLRLTPSLELNAGNPAGREPRLSPASAGRQAWELKRPRRNDALSWPIYMVLKAAHEGRERRPTAIDVLEAFALKRPPEVLEVMANEIKFLSLNGDIKSANLETIRGRISRMTVLQKSA